MNGAARKWNLRSPLWLRTKTSCVASGALLTAAGIPVIGTLPVAPVWRWLAAGAWCLNGLREILGIASGYRRYGRIRIDSEGAIALQAPGGNWMAAEVRDGSVVLQRYAWLRFRLPDGSGCGELLRGDSLENEHWRRFQLVWRHLGGAR